MPDTTDLSFLLILFFRLKHVVQFVHYLTIGVRDLRMKITQLKKVLRLEHIQLLEETDQTEDLSKWPSRKGAIEFRNVEAKNFISKSTSFKLSIDAEANL